MTVTFAGAVARDEIAFVPLLRRGARIAHLVVVAPRMTLEPRRHVVFGGGAHLALHLDRVLSMIESEQDRFRSILDSLPQAVVLTDAALRVVQANASALAMADVLETRPGARLGAIGDVDLAALAAGIHDEPGTVTSAEARRPGGRTLAVMVSRAVATRDRGSGFVVVVTDVTEARRLQDRLAQAEKLSSLGRMLSGVAHELNNPLASVLGFSQLAASTAPGAALTKRLGMIHDEARRCQKIVQNLLRFARRHEPQTAALALNEIVESTGAQVGYQLRVDGISLVLDLDRSVLVGDLVGLVEFEQRLVEGLHPQLSRALHDVLDLGHLAGGTPTLLDRRPAQRNIFERR